MDKVELGKRISNIRRSKKELSSYELSLRLDKDATYMHKIESGKAFPSMEMFFEICKALEISPKDIFQ